MGRNIGRHTDSNAGRAVHQQIGEAAGQNSGFFFALVKVGIPVDGILVDITEHFIGKLGKARLGITVGSSGVAVDITEVTLTVHQHIAHGEILRKTHHGIVNRSVTVGMIATQHRTDGGCRLLVLFIGGQTVFVHGVQNTAVNRLQTVTNVGKRTANDDAHGVFNIGFFHFIHQIAGGDMLIRKHNIFRLVISIMLCHFSKHLHKRNSAAKPQSLPPRGRWPQCAHWGRKRNTGGNQKVSKLCQTSS